jgi:hypothetical protein
MLDKEGNPDPPGYRLGVGLTSSPLKASIISNPGSGEFMARKQAETSYEKKKYKNKNTSHHATVVYYHTFSASIFTSEMPSKFQRKNLKGLTSSRGFQGQPFQ